MKRDGGSSRSRGARSPMKIRNRSSHRSGPRHDLWRPASLTHSELTIKMNLRERLQAGGLSLGLALRHISSCANVNNTTAGSAWRSTSLPRKRESTSRKYEELDSRFRGNDVLWKRDYPHQPVTHTKGLSKPDETNTRYGPACFQRWAKSVWQLFPKVNESIIKPSAAGYKSTVWLPNSGFCTR